jgi:hypothetical protein
MELCEGCLRAPKKRPHTALFLMHRFDYPFACWICSSITRFKFAGE